jgi:MoaA/NifB/PqqE/SkfB family radical SAM enzyme
VTYGRVDLSRYCVMSVWFGCNSRCSICMLSRVEDGLPPIGLDRFRAVTAEVVRRRKHDGLILSGGEVTTFDELTRYVRFAASFGWFRKIQIQTNGRRLKERDYVAEQVESGVNEFFVSIQGLEQSHEATTCVPGSFAETIAGLRNLANHKVNVISNTVLTKGNLGDITPLFALLAGECVSEMQLWNFFPMGATDPAATIVDLHSLYDLMPGLAAIAVRAGKPVVLKSFPQCLAAGPPLFLDSLFPVTALPDRFWQQFRECGFGQCFHRGTGQCKSWQCWGLSSAYLRQYGDERQILRPIGDPE